MSVIPMKEVTFTVRLKGDVADLVTDLVNRGYSGSKTEAIRTSLIFYGIRLGLISPKMLHKKALIKIAKSNERYSDKEIERQISELEA